MPKRIVIDDFRGGRNTLDAAYKIKQSQHITGSRDVWAPTGILSKRPGQSSSMLPTWDAAAGTLKSRQLFLTQLGASSTARTIIAALYQHTAEGLAHVGLAYTENGTSASPVGYADGTVSTAGSSQTVTGSGTAWSTNVAVGDILVIGTNIATATIRRITAVNSDTEIVVATAVNLSAGTAYTIVQQLNSARPLSGLTFDVSGAQNFFIVDGGSRTAFRYTGTTTALVSAMPAFRIIKAHKNYVFGIMHNDTAIRWCALADATSWPSNNSQTVTTVGNPTRGLAVYGDHLVIFCRSKIYRLLGDTFDPSNPTYVLEEISTPPNFLFTMSRTIVIHEGVLKFLAQDGWYAYTGGNSIEKISQAIQPDVDALFSRGQAPEQFADSAVAAVWNKRMWCSVPTSSAQVNRYMVVQDENGAWWQWQNSQTDQTITDMLAVRYGTTGSLLFQGATSFNADGPGNLVNLDTGSTDISSAITGTWISKDFVFPQEIEFLSLIVVMEKQSSGNLNCDYSLDQAAFVATAADMSTGVGTIIEKRIPIASMGKSIRVRLTNAANNVTFGIHAVMIEYEPSDSDAYRV